MSNRNFYNNDHGNNFTFQNNFAPQTSIPPPPFPPPTFIPPPIPPPHCPPPHCPPPPCPPPPCPPPPCPPPFYMNTPPPMLSSEITDQKFVRSFERKIPIKNQKVAKHNSVSISQVREQLYEMVLILNELKKQEDTLENNIDALSDEEWSSYLKEIEEKKANINKLLSNINDSQLDTLRRLVAKRAAKRLRLKRVHSTKKREKEEWIKESQERSRKIDENLQKVKDDINKVKQQEQAKLQADIVLKEVLRKRIDAKKCVTKLDALMKLRKARENTARGRGETVSMSEAVAFIRNIGKLKTLWSQKLSAYEKEEAEQRAKLMEDSQDLSIATNETKQEVSANLNKWLEVMFGGGMPQMDFQGDIGRFVAVRTQWDQFLSNEGTSLPIGWVPPPS